MQIIALLSGLDVENNLPVIQSTAGGTLGKMVFLGRVEQTREAVS